MNQMALDHVWLTIILCSALTFGLRYGGLQIATKIQKYPRFKSLLDALPGCVLVALIAPELLLGGANQLIAGGLVIAMTLFTKNVFLSMGVGVIGVALLRSI